MLQIIRRSIRILIQTNDLIMEPQMYDFLLLILCETFSEFNFNAKE